MRNTFAPLGANNHVDEDRAEDDFYATDPDAIDLLFEVETFSELIWEPACGMGHLSKRMKLHGKSVFSSDLVDRNYPCAVFNFLDIKLRDGWNGDIITNPPYNVAVDFIKNAIDVVSRGCKVAMFLKLLFLEGQARKDFFLQYPPKTVYVSASRILCAKDGDFINNKTKAVAYAWYVWEKGYQGETIIKWVN